MFANFFLRQVQHNNHLQSNSFVFHNDNAPITMSQEVRDLNWLNRSFEKRKKIMEIHE